MIIPTSKRIVNGNRRKKLGKNFTVYQPISRANVKATAAANPPTKMVCAPLHSGLSPVKQPLKSQTGTMPNMSPHGIKRTM
jgi:hypothetical protein